MVDSRPTRMSMGVQPTLHLLRYELQLATVSKEALPDATHSLLQLTLGLLGKDASCRRCVHVWVNWKTFYVSFHYVGIISSVSPKPNPTFLSSLTHNWSKVSSTCMLLYLLFVVRTLLVDQRFPCCSHCHNVLYSVIRRGCASRHCAVIRYLCSARVVWGGVGCPHSVVQQTSFPCPEPVEISLYAPSDDWLLCNIMYKNM